MPVDESLLASFETVNSKDEGLRLVNLHASEITDALADALRERAAALNAAKDRLGAEEFEAWANEARSIVTLREVQSLDPDNVDVIVAFLKSNFSRFDDAFIDMCSLEAQSRISELGEALGKSELDAASGLAMKAASEVRWLDRYARVSGRPAHQAEADFAGGTFLLYQAQLEEAQGDHGHAAKTREQARQRLGACTQNQAASGALRGRAFQNLAMLADVDRPDQIDSLKEQAQVAATGSGDLQLLQRIRRERAYRAQQRHDSEAAYSLYQQNIEDTEKALRGERSPIAAMRLVEDTAPDYADIVELCLEKAKSDASYYERALEFADQGKARAFLRTLANVAISLKPVPPRLQARRQRIFDRLRGLGALQGRSPTMAERRRPEMEELLEALAETESQIYAYTGRFALNLQCSPLKFEQMPALVPGNGAILSYFYTREKLLTFVITKEGLAGPPAELPDTDDRLGRMIVDALIKIRSGETHTLEAIGEWLGSPDYFAPEAPLRALYQRLIEPVAAQLQGCTQVCIVPHFGLRSLPFHALTRPDGSALIDSMAVSYAPSLAVLRWCQDRETGPIKTCFAAGVSAAKGGPEGAAEEARAVAKIFGTAASPATRAAVLEEAGKCDVIHLACHSNVSGMALTSFQGLALEDGILTQHEIAGIECRSSLVTLSACDTAEADLLPGFGQEMTGLTGAFYRAGCPSVICSLWPVADRAAVPMMQALYASLLKTQNRAQALQEAQRAIKSRPEFAHPFFWAAFSLWGKAG
jgi:hypothetical protein